MPDLRQRALALYAAFTHEHRDRRTLLRQMVALAGSVAAAEALIAGIAATPAAASISKTDDPRLKTGRQTYTLGESRRLDVRSEEHTSELQSLMRSSYAVFCWTQKNKTCPHTSQL